MRVIAGTARGIPLLTPEGKGTRPTTDRIKETLFNILAPDIADVRFLDLFGGSGGIAIEALSRGAAYAFVIERDRRAVGIIRKNLEKTKLADKASVFCTDALTACRKMSHDGQKFDLVFLDPPYASDYVKALFMMPEFCSLLEKDSVIVVEADLDADFSNVGKYGFILDRKKEYKTNMHLFFHYERE